jgi:Protein of unknown function (DUF1822)
MLKSLSLKINLPQYLLNSKHDKQVQIDSLALYAANWYLQCLQFDTKHDDSEDWWIQYLSKSTPLEIAGIGKIECIGIADYRATTILSKDLEFDRIGYLFVRLNDSLTSAEILGFTPNYSETIRLDRLQSTDALIDYLCDLESPSEVLSVVKLAEWLEGLFNSVWQDVEGLSLSAACRSLTPAYRSQELQLSAKSVDRGRKIQLGSSAESQSVIVTVGIQPIDNLNSNLYLQIYPEYPNPTLPIGLKFSAIGDDGVEIGSVQTKEGDISGEIVLEGGKSGEKFSISIEFDGITKIESFEI